jgi:flagellar L-ring protein precursor FlgH
MKTFKYLMVLSVALMMTACATPKRGDAEYAPVMPMQYHGPIRHGDAIYQADSSWLLHEDIRARRVGDMLTVTLQEKTDAEKSAETGTSKASSNSIAAPTILGAPFTVHGKEIFETSLSSDHAFDGEGESSQSNSLNGSVTVVVVKVLANGYLVVQGEKWININQGEEYLRVRGIVRPSDINPDNTIDSTRIANAQIQYSGDSVLSDANEPGWLTKILTGPWMPF